MNREEFLAAVAREGIRPATYSLDGGMPAEKYVVSREGDEDWAVYYSERGIRRDENRFSTEGEALDLLLIWLVEDNTTRDRSG